MIRLKYKNWLLIVFLLLIGNQLVNSQKYSQTIIGKVIDKDTKMTLPGAAITILGTQPLLGSVSDNNGNFKIENVPFGRYDIRCTFLGYEIYMLSQVPVGAGKELVLSIELTESVTEIQSVEITSDKEKDKPLNEMITVSSHTFSVDETQRYAASFNDPSRMALSFAGVSTTNDASNEIVVRGNSARGLLWRIEGIEIPNPNHFSNGEGATGGGISILSAQVLGTSDFLTGAFPSEYGNALSGVFDIRFRKGNYTRWRNAIQFGVLGMQASLEGPFSKKYDGSYLVNYRYSTLMIFNAIGLPVVDNGIVPEFQDLSFNFSFPAGKAGTFTLFGIGGISKAGEIAIKDSNQWVYRRDRFQDFRIQYVGATGITHTLPFKNNKTYLKTVVALTGESNAYKLDSLDNNYDLRNSYDEKYDYYSLRTNMFVNHKFNAKHIIRTGVMYSHLFYNLRSSGLILSTNSYGTFLDEKGSAGMIQAYFNWKYRINTKLEMVTGLHHLFFLLNNNFTIEPRWGLRWQVHKLHALSIGAGMHSRIEPISNYLGREQLDSVNFIQPNKTLDLTKTVHVVLGYDWVFYENMRLKLEAYFQYLYDVPVNADSGSTESMLNFSGGFARTEFSNQGLGRNYGVELTLEKFFSKNYFFLITASFFNSEYSIGDGVWRNTRFNGNYMLNVLGGYELKFGKQKQSSWSINSRIIWRGGNRYIPIDLDASVLQGSEVLVEENAYTERLPDFFRWDLSTAVKFNFKKWAFSISLEVQNVINRKNINRYGYDPYLQEIRTDYMFGIMPVFNFKFEF